MFKRYKVNNLTDLDSVRDWIKDLDHRGQLIMSLHPPNTEWYLIVEDASGLPPVSPLAEKELEGLITETDWPE
jgi:hypothetical protein